MSIYRAISPQLRNRFFKGKALIVFGPRQCGKTTMLADLLRPYGDEVLYLNGDEADVRDMFDAATSAKLRTIIGKHKIVFIDEAQRIPNIGITLKLMTDQIKDVQTIATGSSAFELASKTGESLTGRKYEYQLYPLWFGELAKQNGLLDEQRMLEHRLIYGYYPEIVTSPGDEQELLGLLTSSYLYKDLLALDGINKPRLLDKILKALALQLGGEVALNEVATLVGADMKTVDRYIDLLKKAFVLYELEAYSTNQRKEIRKKRKIYFYDNGIRNTIIGNYLPVGNRTDIGGLWENFLISERMKYLRYTGKQPRIFFWRNDQQEIDYIEEHTAGKLEAYQFKWGINQKAKFPRGFSTLYPDAKKVLITRDNYIDFIGGNALI